MLHGDDRPAFPYIATDPLTGHQIREPGMTLRDWFAGQALVGILANANFNHNLSDKIGAAAYEAADLMMQERSK